jgi:hypothetical protein
LFKFSILIFGLIWFDSLEKQLSVLLFLSFLIGDSFSSTSCPPDEVIYPCKCILGFISELTISCGSGNYILKKVFESFRRWDARKDWESFELKNTSEKEFEADLFGSPLNLLILQNQQSWREFTKMRLNRVAKRPHL